MQEQKHSTLRVHRLRRTVFGCKPSQHACTTVSLRSLFLSATRHYAVNLPQCGPRARLWLQGAFLTVSMRHLERVQLERGLAASSFATHRLLPSRGDVSECKHYMVLTNRGWQRPPKRRVTDFYFKMQNCDKSML
jgi:hypothetical protein